MTEVIEDRGICNNKRKWATRETKEVHTQRKRKEKENGIRKRSS